MGQENSGQGGDVNIEKGELSFTVGRPETGIKWLGDAPTSNYELLVELYFPDKQSCNIVFPVGSQFCAYFEG